MRRIIGIIIGAVVFGLLGVAAAVKFHVNVPIVAVGGAFVGLMLGVAAFQKPDDDRERFRKAFHFYPNPNSTDGERKAEMAAINTVIKAIEERLSRVQGKRAVRVTNFSKDDKPNGKDIESCKRDLAMYDAVIFNIERELITVVSLAVDFNYWAAPDQKAAPDVAAAATAVPGLNGNGAAHQTDAVLRADGTAATVS